MKKKPRIRRKPYTQGQALDACNGALRRYLRERNGSSEGALAVIDACLRSLGFKAKRLYVPQQGD